jgi:hypothetical protein
MDVACSHGCGGSFEDVNNGLGHCAWSAVEIAQNGAICERWVVVEYGVQDGDPPDTPKGIITSYGRFVRNAD